MMGILVSFQSFFPAMTKIVGTLGPKSRSVEIISHCLKAGMSGNLMIFHIHVVIDIAKNRFMIFMCCG